MPASPGEGMNNVRHGGFSWRHEHIRVISWETRSHGSRTADARGRSRPRWSGASSLASPECINCHTLLVKGPTTARPDKIKQHRGEPSFGSS